MRACASSRRRSTTCTVHPRARGIDLPPAGTRANMRLIHACAGATASRGPSRARKAVHPRDQRFQAGSFQWGRPVHLLEVEAVILSINTGQPLESSTRCAETTVWLHNPENGWSRFGTRPRLGRRGVSEHPHRCGCGSASWCRAPNTVHPRRRKRCCQERQAVAVRSIRRVYLTYWV